MQQLAASINVKAKVTLLRSALAKVPMVIGHFKPVILIPAGVFTALPQDEIEAILLHELAHIRRKDYLVNMLQHFCEILFFFNPAVLWLSSLIKDERENCCDDIALNQVKNKKQFIHALISFQEYNMAANNCAVGFPGREGHLLNRVKRIITNNNKTLTNMEKTILATALVLVSFVTLAIAQTKKAPPVKKGQAVAQTDKKPANSNAQGDTNAVNNNDDNFAPVGEAQDTIPAGNNYAQGHSSSNYSTTIDGKTYKLVEEDGELKEFYVEGDKIPADKISQYQNVIEKMHRQIGEYNQQQNKFNLLRQQYLQSQQQFKKQQELYTQQQQLYSKQADTVHSQKYLEAQKLYLQQQEMYNQVQQEYRNQMDSNRQYIYSSPVYITAPVAPVTVTAPHVVATPAVASAKANVSVAQPVSVTAPTITMMPVRATVNTPAMVAAPAIVVTPAIAPVSPAITVSPAVVVTAPAISVKPALFVSPVAPTSNTLVNGIIRDLKGEGMSITEDDITFKLDAKELIINGVKQPDALHTKLKAKYLKGPNDFVKYNADGDTMHIDIFN